MEREFDEVEGGRVLGGGLITSWVLAAMMIIMSTFLAQFPDAGATETAQSGSR